MWTQSLRSLTDAPPPGSRSDGIWFRIRSASRSWSTSMWIFVAMTPPRVLPSRRDRCRYAARRGPARAKACRAGARQGSGPVAARGVLGGDVVLVRLAYGRTDVAEDLRQ